MRPIVLADALRVLVEEKQKIIKSVLAAATTLDIMVNSLMVKRMFVVDMGSGGVVRCDAAASKERMDSIVGGVLTAAVAGSPSGKGN